MTLTQEIRDEIKKLMEYYAKNPSNSNKALHSMYALFEDEEVYREDKMKEPSKLQLFMYRLSDKYWQLWHKLGRHKWVAMFEKDIEVINGQVRHQDGTPPVVTCDICYKPAKQTKD